MPSQYIASQIETYRLPQEKFEDFATLFDILMRLRQPYQKDESISENVAGRILCVFVPDKPENYVKAMQEFRLQFAGVST